MKRFRNCYVLCGVAEKTSNMNILAHSCAFLLRCPFRRLITVRINFHSHISLTFFYFFLPLCCCCLITVLHSLKTNLKCIRARSFAACVFQREQKKNIYLLTHCSGLYAVVLNKRIYSAFW